MQRGPGHVHKTCQDSRAGTQAVLWVHTPERNGLTRALEGIV